MTAFALNSSKIVGTAAGLSWSQTHVFTPPDKQKKQTFGSLLASLCFEAKKEELDITSFGKEIISRFHEIYYSSEEKQTLARLRQAIKKLIDEFKDEVSLQIVSAVILEKGNQALGYFSLVGRGRVIIWRENQLVALLAGRGGEIKSSSGYLKDKDILVLATEEFFQSASEGVLRSSLESGHPAAAVETLAPAVHSRKDNSQIAGVIFQVQKTRAVELEPALETEREKPGEERSAPEAEKRKIRRRMGDLTFFTRNLSFLAKKFIRDFKKQPDVYLKDKTRKTKAKKTTLTVALILIVLLVTSIILGSRKKIFLKESERTREIFEQANYKYEQALSLEEVNPLRVRSLLSEAKKLIEETEERKESEQLVELLAKIEEALQKVAKEYQIEKAEVFMELGLVKEDFKGTDLAYSDGVLQILDPEKATVLELKPESKEGRISAGGEKLVEARRIGYGEGRIFVLRRNRLMVVDADKGEVIDEKEGEDWREITDLVGFGNNAYLLDTDQGKIFKYAGTGDGLADPSNYFKTENLNLEDAVSFSIDGSVWLLFSDGTVVKFTRGAKDAFTVSGMAEDFKEPEKIYTDSELDNLYILDRKNTRVVVISKDTGEYQAQYVWPGIAGALDIFASEAEKKILLLMGERIYGIELESRE